MSHRGRLWWVVGLLVVLVLAGAASSYASDQPDGLEKVAGDEGFLSSAEEHDLADGPLAGYEVAGVDDERLAVGLAGVAGVASTLALGGGLLWLARRRDAGPVEDPTG